MLVKCLAGSPPKEGLLREVGEEEGESPPGGEGSQGNAGRRCSSGSWEAETRRPSPGPSGGQLSCVPSQGGPHLPGTEPPRQL